MTTRPGEGWRRVLGRLLPVTLGGRLVLTVLLLAALVSAITIIMDTTIVRAQAGPAGLSSSLVWLAIVSTVAASLVAAMIGALVGIWIARLARQPVEIMVDRVASAGASVLDGETYLGKGGLPDPLLPRELNDLSSVVDDVLVRLAEKQAELRDAIANLRAAEEALDAVVSGSLDSQLLVEGDTIVLANPAAAIALGFSPESLNGSSLSALTEVTVLDEEGEPLETRAVIDRALEGPVTVHIERDGGRRSYVVRATRPTGNNGERVLVTGRHVTEELRAQRIRSEIVELVSHDLRAPLAVVNGYLDVLRRSLSDEDRIRAVEAAKRDAARMSDLLEDLLSAAQAEQLLAPDELVPVSLAELAEEVAASLSTAHPARALRADAADGGHVLGDGKRLRQALVNLVTNALRYSPDDSPVTIRVSCAGPRACLSVEDHGPGVPEDQRELVFERYARLEGGSGRRPGLGLGLYIVRVIAENHGGSTRVEETPGGGATFVIDLPAVAAASSQPAPA